MMTDHVSLAQFQHRCADLVGLWPGWTSPRIDVVSLWLGFTDVVPIGVHGNS
jgi:hypothetical protein